MLSALPPQQTDPILDLPTDNWSIFTQAFTQLCFTKFGVAGQQILSDRVIPLVPFATAPTKKSLESDAKVQDWVGLLRRKCGKHVGKLTLNNCQEFDPKSRRRKEETELFKGYNYVCD
jgi:hypothetical protein